MYIFFCASFIRACSNTVLSASTSGTMQNWTFEDKLACRTTMYFQKKIIHQTAHKKLEPYHPNAPRNRPKETVQTALPLYHHFLSALWLQPYGLLAEHASLACDHSGPVRFFGLCSCKIQWAIGTSFIPASSEYPPALPVTDAQEHHCSAVVLAPWRKSVS